MRSDLICRIAILSSSSPNDTGTEISDMALSCLEKRPAVYRPRLVRRPGGPYHFAPGRDPPPGEIRRGGRGDDCTCTEIRQAFLSHRGFDSHPPRDIRHVPTRGDFSDRTH